MEMPQFFLVLLHDTLVLFAMVNAIGNLPLFADLTAGLDARARRKAYHTAVLTAGSIVVSFAVLGNWMLRHVFEVDTASFKVAGGILVFTVAARGFLLGADRHPLMEDKPGTSVGVFPMGFPFLSGPGTIVTTIILMQQGGPLVTALAAALVYLMVLPLLYLTRFIHAVVERVAILVLSRILYIFIAAKAVSFVLTGLKASLGWGAAMAQ